MISTLVEVRQLGPHLKKIELTKHLEGIMDNNNFGGLETLK